MLRFIELNQDKSPRTDYSVTYPTMDNLENAGLMLNNDVVLIDFDGDNKEKEKWIIEQLKLNYPTLNIKTDKGYHFYYSKPSDINIKSKSDVITVGGFQCDYKTGNQYAIVKRYGKERERNQELTLTGLPELPQILYPINLKTNLSNMTDGDGRNDGIFTHLCCVRQKYPDIKIEELGEYINNNIFSTPLNYRELNSTINSVLSRKIESKVNNSPLEIISALELKNTAIKPIRFIVEDMLPQGLNLICSPPKYGKSWLMLDLCLSVASGEKFLNHNTNQCQCLYLALEDSKYRLKDRMIKVLNGKEPSPNFDFSIKCGNLNNNLINQLNEYITKKPTTGLIVIDTLQKIRGSSSKSDSAYGNDYKELGILKSFADEKDICILLVHHLRKMGDSGDVFSRISGTNAIMGASDTIFILDREKRTDNDTVLSMTGRDIEENEYIIQFDKSIFKWRLIGGLEAENQRKQFMIYESNPIVRTIKDLLKDKNKYVGTASEILDRYIELFGEDEDLKPSNLSKKIKEVSQLLLIYDGITYEAPPKNGKGGIRPHKFTYKIDFSGINTDDDI